MYNLTLDLGMVSQDLKLTFNVLVKTDEDVSRLPKGNYNTISNFKVSDTEYIRVNSAPYLVFDIGKSADRYDSYNPNSRVHFNNYFTKMLIILLKELLASFKIKSLYYTRNGKLILDKNEAPRTEYIAYATNKKVCFSHTVIPDKHNEEIEYEGVIMYINTPDNFINLTYNELQVLYLTLMDIRFGEIGLQLILMYLQTKYPKIEPVTLAPKLISEVKDNSYERIIPQVQKPNVLPEI